MSGWDSPKRASLDRAGNAKSWALGHSSVRWGPRSKIWRTAWERATRSGAREPRVFRFPEARWRKRFPKKGSTKSDAAEDCRRILRTNFWCSTQDPYKSSFDGGMGTKVGDFRENREQSWRQAAGTMLFSGALLWNKVAKWDGSRKRKWHQERVVRISLVNYYTYHCSSVYWPFPFMAVFFVYTFLPRPTML